MRRVVVLTVVNAPGNINGHLLRYVSLCMNVLVPGSQSVALSSISRKHWDCIEEATSLQMRPFESEDALPSASADIDMFSWSGKDERSHSREYMAYLGKVFKLNPKLG